MQKKRAVTLIEVMIVILLIGLIGGALAYNMRGSLDEGRIFKSQQNKERIEQILLLEEAKGDLSAEQIAEKWEDIVVDSPLGGGKKTIVDGWNKPFDVSYNQENFIVESTGLEKALEKKSKATKMKKSKK